MIVSDKEQGQVYSNVTGVNIPMSVDADEIKQLMGIVERQYSDRQKAFIREYSTNGWDSHIEAGQTRPIEVTLPTYHEPIFTVKDFGVGMDKAVIEDVYSKYAASTKRDSNDQGGTFGIGSKSAFAYANTFTVVGVKGGIRTTVIVTRNEIGGGNMMIADEAGTSEPNGVEIKIQIQPNDISSVERKAREFFRFWQPGSVLVDGVEPDLIERKLKVNDHMFITDEVSEHMVVMANVAYPIDLDLELIRGHHLVVEVPIGAVKPTPAREALEDIPQTVAVQEAIVKEFEAEIAKVIQREVEQAATPWEAIKAANGYRDAVGVQVEGIDLRYNGREIPKDWTPGKDKNGNARERAFVVSHENDYWGKQSSHSRSGVIAREIWPKTLWVTGYEPGKFVANHKKKLIKYQEEQGLGYQTYVLLPEGTPPKGWLAPDQIVKWETIRSIKLPRKQGARHDWDPNRVPGSYDIYIDGVSSTVIDEDIPTDNGIFYSEGIDYDDSEYRVIKANHPGATFVPLAKNRLTKFKRLFPEAKNISKQVESDFKAWQRSLTPLQLVAFEVADYYSKRTYGALYPHYSDLKDPRLKRWARATKYDLTALSKVANMYRNVRLHIKDPNEEAPLEAYPLYDEDILAMKPQHVIDYLNFVYEKEIKNV